MDGLVVAGAASQGFTLIPAISEDAGGALKHADLWVTRPAVPHPCRDLELRGAGLLRDARGGVHA